MSALRILHISTRLILGGSQENTVLSCEGQARHGHDVHLAFGPIYGPEGSLLHRVQQFRSPAGRSITTHLVPNLIRELNPLRDALAYRELRTLIAQLRPDVVHTHSSKAGILGRIASSRTHWPAASGQRSCPRTIHTIHGPPFMPLEGSGLAQARIACTNTLYEIAERTAAAHCDRIVSVADAMTQQFLARDIGWPSLYTTVRSGMDLTPFLHPPHHHSRSHTRAALGLQPSDFVIGTVARLAQHKGHDDLLDALAADLVAHPHWKLLWVGDGWWRQRLLDKATALGIRSRDVSAGLAPLLEGTWPSQAPAPAPDHHSAQLLLTGLVPPDIVPPLMRSMDVLAHPSSREGLPRTVPQALLAGALPIAYDCDGTREACIHMHTGLLVPVGDVARLRTAIRWAFEHPAPCRDMIRIGHTLCVRSFSTDAMLEGLARVYRG